MFRVGLFDHVPAEGAQAAAAPATNSNSIATATQVAEEGTVLLKNGGGVLPLFGQGKRIAVIGPAANQPGATFAEEGYGSGHVPEFGYQPGVVSPLQAITERAAQNGDVVTYADGDVTADAVRLTTAAAATAQPARAIPAIAGKENLADDRPLLTDVLGHVDTLLYGPAGDRQWQRNRAG
jgi:beta-glucosidase